MAVCLEGYLLINFTINFALLGIIARSQGMVKWPGVFGGAAFGALYAVAMQYDAFMLLRMLPFKAMLVVTMAAAALKTERLRDLAEGSITLLLATVFTGGLARIVLQAFNGSGLWSLLIGTITGVIALLGVLKVRSRRIEQWEVQLRLRTAWGKVHLTAFVDTGNRLREPISDLPVIIVEERLLRRALPEGFDARRALAALPQGFRLVGYGALGGSGRMVCFHPDELLVSYGNGWMRAPDVWIAVYDGTMPGSESALAPAVIGKIS